MRIDAGAFESVQRRIERLVPDIEELSFAGRALVGGEKPDWLIKLSNGPMLLDNAVNEIADAAVEYLSCAVIASVTEHAERIDAAVVSAASAAGGECEGLTFHIKGRESLARKIHDDGMLSPKGYRVTDIAVIERVANGVKDALHADRRLRDLLLLNVLSCRHWQVCSHALSYLPFGCYTLT